MNQFRAIIVKHLPLFCKWLVGDYHGDPCKDHLLNIFSRFHTTQRVKNIYSFIHPNIYLFTYLLTYDIKFCLISARNSYQSVNEWNQWNIPCKVTQHVYSFLNRNQRESVNYERKVKWTYFLRYCTEKSCHLVIVLMYKKSQCQCLQMGLLCRLLTNQKVGFIQFPAQTNLVAKFLHWCKIPKLLGTLHSAEDYWRDFLSNDGQDKDANRLLEGREDALRCIKPLGRLGSVHY